MLTTGSGYYDSPAYLEAARRRCGHRMKAFLKQVDFHGVKVDTLCVAGYCPAAICEAAEKERVDLIVISPHGRTGLGRAFLGSVAETTVRHAQCPVLVVRSFCRVRKGDNHEGRGLTAQTPRMGIFSAAKMRRDKKRMAFRNS